MVHAMFPIFSLVDTRYSSSRVLTIEQSRVGSLEGGVEFLELCGFEKIDGGKFLFLPHDKVDLAALNLAGTQLESALTNPFFGFLEK